jgi:hypothetical protein
MIVQKLRDPNIGFLLFIFALATQIYHTQVVSMGISKGSGWDLVTSIGSALALETTVLYAVANRRISFSYVFAAISIAINVAYYESGLSQTQSMFYFDLIGYTWSKWVFSVIVPVNIAFYSHVLAETLDETNPLPSSSSWFSRLFSKVKPQPKVFVWDKSTDEEKIVSKTDIPFVFAETVEEGEQLEKQIGDKHQAILKYLEKNGPATCPKISENTGVAPMTLKRKDKNGNPRGYLEDLLTQHMIVGVKNGKAIEYSLNGKS